MWRWGRGAGERQGQAAVEPTKWRIGSPDPQREFGDEASGTLEEGAEKSGDPGLAKGLCEAEIVIIFKLCIFSALVRKCNLKGQRYHQVGL